MIANAARGEAVLRLENTAHLLRPSFAALVAAEEELGPLFALVDRAAEGRLALAEMIGLFWHCLDNRDGILRSDFGDAVLMRGLAAATPVLKILLTQILAGR